MNSHDQPSVEALEQVLPRSSAEVFYAARHEALHAGLPVMDSQDGGIFRVSPDGGREFVKSVDPPVPVQCGKVYRVP